MATILCLILCATLTTVTAIRWQHSAQLDDNFRLLWNLNTDATITIELQVRTHGYVGIGFARPDTAPQHTDRAGADMIVGWVAHGQTYLQDRHFKPAMGGGSGAEPRVDAADDCTLLLGYENATHTVLRFQRALETCDGAHDVAITNDTMRVLFMYHEREPLFGRIAPGSLPHASTALRGIVPLQMAQRTERHAHRRHASVDEEPAVATIELLNQDVPLPSYGETLQWCRLFELNDFSRKHHMIRYEPVFGSPAARQQLDRIVLYECQGNSVRLTAMARDAGRSCGSMHARTALPCNAVVASWTRGSAGLTFPPEAGIALDSTKERFYLMQSHYTNTAMPESLDALLSADEEAPLTDDSGLRLHVTAQLRPHDAGVLSVGMNSDWRHIIPPGQNTVTSEGHCVGECTRNAFPAGGIRVFAVLMQTLAIGKQVRLRQIRGAEELLPIAAEGSAHQAYAEYRHVQPAARVMPGDSMVVECTYDSTERETITVGGEARGAGCNVLAVYYPRQKRLTQCHSMPSLPAVLHALGISELSGASQPLLIAAPAALAGMTLESRLLSYDWGRDFEQFEQRTRGGSFQAVCRDARHKTVMGTDRRLYRPVQVQRVWREPQRKSKCAAGSKMLVEESEEWMTLGNSIDSDRPMEGEVYEVMSMGLSGSAGRISSAGAWSLVAALVALVTLRLL